MSKVRKNKQKDLANPSCNNSNNLNDINSKCGSFNKTRLIYPILGIFISLGIFVCSSYAFWNSESTAKQESTNVVVNDCLSLSFLGLSNDVININNSFPMTTGQALNNNSVNYYTFSVYNNCNKPVDFVVGIRDAASYTSGAENFNPEYISVALDNVGMGKLSDLKTIENPDDSSSPGRIIGYDTIPANGASSHSVTIWLNELADNSVMNKNFATNIFIAAGQDNDGSMITNKIQLAYMIKESAVYSNIDFSKHSSTPGYVTNGIYITKNTDFGNEVYYYRGDVNNYIIFGNYCWRIMRTTDTGGVKLLYAGIPTDNQCLDTSPSIGSSRFSKAINDSAYVGYMYGTVPSTSYAEAHSNLNNSYAKTTIDNWYVTNFLNTEYEKYIEDTVYCNNRNVADYDSGLIGYTTIRTYGTLGYGNNPTIYASAATSSRSALYLSPSLACKNNSGFVSKDNDAFTVSDLYGNGNLNYPIGMITSDEAIFAGLNSYYSDHSSADKYTNELTYLKSDSTFFTMTPQFNSTSAVVFNGINKNGTFSNSSAALSYATRPVISLKPGITIKSTGDGTSTNPYIVELD